MIRGIVWAVLLSLIGVGGIWSAHAVNLNSTNYSVNGNIGDSVAGSVASTNYKLVAAAGESIAGSGSSKSYKLGQGYVPQLENSIQVVTQPSQLAAYWPLDDVVGGGPAVDESQNANNGTYEASSVNVAGKVGRAWSDLNTNQFVSIPENASFPTGTAMTVSAWVNSSSLTNQRAIITKWDYAVGSGKQGEWAVQLAPTAGQLRVFVSSGNTDDGVNYVDTTNAGLTTGSWYHVAVVYDGSQAAANRIRIYVNGTQASTTMGGTIPSTLYSTPSNPITIGDFPGLSRMWAGAIDEAKIYNRALTRQDIQAEVDAGNAGVSAGMSLGSITPGVSQTSAFDSVVQTSAAGYTLAINQNNNLTSGGNTIPSVSGSIASPVTWNEGSTKGLGFTLFGTNATAIPGTWASGSAYAALPGSATSFYTRTNYSGGAKDVLNMRLRLDTTVTQATGDYTNRMTITGTMTP